MVSIIIVNWNGTQFLLECLEGLRRQGWRRRRYFSSTGREIIDRADDGYTKAGAALLRGRGGSVDCHRVCEWVSGGCAAAAIVTH